MAAVDHDADDLDGGNAEVGERAQQAVLAPGQALADGLERVQLAAVLDEPDDMPGDAALADLHQPLVLPLLERLRPRQGQQAGYLTRRRAENKPHVALRSGGRAS